jgi:hypothetical protein
MQRVSKSHRERRANAKRASLRRANAEDNARLRIGVAESLSVEEQRVRIKAARKKLKAELRGLAA